MDRGFLEVVGEIYEASYKPEYWAEVLGSIATYTDSDSAILAYRDKAHPEGNQLALYPLDNETILSAAAEYQKKYMPLDPMWRLLRSGKSIGSSSDSTRLVPNRKSWIIECGDEYYNFLQRYNIAHTAGVVVMEEAEKSLGIGLQRYGKRDAWSDKQLRFLDDLSPHFRRAFRIHSTIVELTLSKTAVASCLDRALFGLIVLNSQGRVILTNSIADKITSANTILNIRGETLYVADPVQQRTLNTLIESAISDEQSGYQPNESVMALRGRNGSALTVFISPFRYFQNHLGVLSSNGGVCLLLSDPDRVQEVSEVALKKIYKLTASEVKVALLVANGLSVSDISRVRNVWEKTVRAQLKAIMRKVGVSSQVQLVKLILSQPAV